MIDLATGLESQLTQSAQGNYSATFSHSGDRIAFHSESDDGAQIVVSDLGGDNQRRVTSGPGFRYGPRWSPDEANNSLAFTTVYPKTLTKPEEWNANDILTTWLLNLG